MDPKASAKSKRSYTQHGRRNHPPTSSVAHKKKPLQTTIGGRGEKLPSNWDRYDNDDDDDESNERPQNSQPVAGELAPKSKGADFSYLIEQAKSQPKDFGYNASLGSSSSFEELSVDFMQGASYMLSARGKSLLSFCGDDNFIVDDDPTSSCEVPFLTLDLHALAGQLSKLKLSQRLFIEPDLLPEEMSVTESKKSSVSEKSEISKPAESDHSSDSPAFLGLAVSEKNDKNDIITSSFVLNDGEMNLGSAAQNDEPHISPLHSTKLDPSKSSKQLEQSGRREGQEPIKQINSLSIPDSEQADSSRFEATAAEAELDMLLDSFSKTSLSGSVLDSLLNKSSVPKNPTFGSFTSVGGQSMGQDPGSSSRADTTSVDDAIDALLAETALSLDDQMHTTVAQKQGELSSISFPHHSPVDSRFVNAGNSLRHIAITDTINDSIDDMLAETSVSLKEQKHTAFQQKEGAVSSSMDLPSHTSCLISKAADGFDSWLETL